jgi:hypothetical protein
MLSYSMVNLAARIADKLEPDSHQKEVGFVLYAEKDTRLNLRLKYT